MWLRRAAGRRLGARGCSSKKDPPEDAGAPPPQEAALPPAGVGRYGATPQDSLAASAAEREDARAAAVSAYATPRPLEPFQTTEVLDHTTELADPGETQIGPRTYSNKYVYTRTSNDGETSIVHKHSPPDNPTAHMEGDILDFSDGAQSVVKHNPFADLAAEAKRGDWGGVSKVAIGVPSAQTRSLYGFERRNQHELTTYGRSSDYLNNAPPEMHEGIHLTLASQRLPGFDETRESLFDKYALRKYVERRDLRLLEREALMKQRNLGQYHSELQLREAQKSRVVYIRDAVMQNPNKWLGLKQMESEEAFVRQGEDVHERDFYANYFTTVMTFIAAALVFCRVYVAGDPQRAYETGAGEVMSISGNPCGATFYSSYRDVGNMYRFNDAVARYQLKNSNAGVSLKEARIKEGHILGMNDPVQLPSQRGM